MRLVRKDSLRYAPVSECCKKVDHTGIGRSVAVRIRMVGVVKALRHLV